ncbi:Microtubule-associated protein 70-2 [Rhynchospora pubera]|uniref:Microtubule-associated protein 70-2 n=1 Tax=Rhynchospora pubera TaxID=906938 RepID=A0AAV8G6I0_9POAL|nr:Microtubule-associated protein 70-2 [Rhynchospora pubera]
MTDASGSASGSGGGKAAPVRRRPSLRRSLDADEFIGMMHGSDPIRVELTRLENQVRDKNRELGEAQAEIKSLRLSERAREKALDELSEEFIKLEEKLKKTESLLESKNLEIKKLNDEKKASVAAQFAAEATLRRVHAAQKDDDAPPIEAILAPLEAELKIARQEIAKLQEDNKALDRLTKSKEAALLEAEKTVKTALAKAALVDDLQNRNQDLTKQIDICQEENRILDRLHRQKIAEVEKLSQTVKELEEAVLAGGAAANAVRDYQRKVQEMNEEKKTLDRELARAKVTANRVAVVVANEWKDGNDKVMPVKQWLEERRIMQGEMQQLRDKLAIAERSARIEAQLKEKYQLRLRVLEDGLRMPSNSSGRTNSEGKPLSNGVSVVSRRQSLGGAGIDKIPKLTSNGTVNNKRSPSPRPSSLSVSSSMVLRRAKGVSKSFDGGSRELSRSATSLISKTKKSGDFANTSLDGGVSEEKEKRGVLKNEQQLDLNNSKDNEPIEEQVSGFLYELLQKEVVTLRKACQEKDQGLKDKESAIEMLEKKVETLTKAMDVEAKKMRREVAAMEKEIMAMRLDKDSDFKSRRLSISKAPVSTRNVPRSS